jgi:hypothetical protein
MIYASGKYALGICDRCGFQFKLNDLKVQFVAQKATNLMVCDGCLDVDHPQLMLGRVRVIDPQALKNPRPDMSPTGLFGWNPVGCDAMTSDVGTVRVSVS